MFRLSYALLTLLVVATSVVVVMRGGEHGPLEAKAQSTASFDAGTSGFDDAGLGADSAVRIAVDEDAAVPLEALALSVLPPDASALGEDAGPSPGLPTDSPRQVQIAVILVQYKGAQGAASNARTHEAALELARQLAAEARVDFKAAVAKGDKGSAENHGHVPRGVLEPAVEFAIFSLKKGDVSDPIDTPRGFWVVQRLD